MEISVNWLSPIVLKSHGIRSAGYHASLDDLPGKPGIYVFGRRWGRSGFEALYVGRANKLRGRIRIQFNNLKLMQHLKDAKSGKRVLLIGQFAARPNQDARKCLPIIEKAFIRHFLSEGHDLVNIQGTLLKRHELTSTGKSVTRLFSKRIYVDRGKSE